MTDLPPGVREAVPDDVPTLLELVHELAAHQRAEPGRVRLDAQGLRVALFGADPAASALVVEHEGAVVGMALWYRTFPTWDGVPGIHLEDLYVRDARRGAGTGRALLTGLARIARDRGYGRVDWTVLRWNEPAIAAYTAWGAESLDDGFELRLHGEALARLAEG